MNQQHKFVCQNFNQILPAHHPASYRCMVWTMYRCHHSIVRLMTQLSHSLGSRASHWADLYTSLCMWWVLRSSIGTDPQSQGHSGLSNKMASWMLNRSPDSSRRSCHSDCERWPDFLWGYMRCSLDCMCFVQWGMTCLHCWPYNSSSWNAHSQSCIGPFLSSKQMAIKFEWVCKQ